MILTINYSDLQNIKKQMIKEKDIDNKKIYTNIIAYKDTLNYMYINGLAKNMSKSNLEFELQDFAKKLLANTNITYKELDKTYKKLVVSNSIIIPNLIKLKI